MKALLVKSTGQAPMREASSAGGDHVESETSRDNSVVDIAALLDMAVEMSVLGLEQWGKDDRYVELADAFKRNGGANLSWRKIQQHIAYVCSGALRLPDNVQDLVEQLKLAEQHGGSKKGMYRLRIPEPKLYGCKSKTILRALKDAGDFPSRGGDAWSRRCAAAATAVKWTVQQVEYHLDWLVFVFQHKTRRRISKMADDAELLALMEAAYLCVRWEKTTYVSPVSTTDRSPTPTEAKRASAVDDTSMDSRAASNTSARGEGKIITMHRKNQFGRRRRLFRVAKTSTHQKNQPRSVVTAASQLSSSSQQGDDGNQQAPDSVDTICESLAAEVDARLLVLGASESEQRCVKERLGVVFMNARLVQPTWAAVNQRDWESSLRQVIEQLPSEADIPELKLPSEPSVDYTLGIAGSKQPPLTRENIRALAKQIPPLVEHVKAVSAIHQRCIHRVSLVTTRNTTAKVSSQQRHADAIKAHGDCKKKTLLAKAANAQCHSRVCSEITTLKSGFLARGLSDPDASMSADLEFHTSADTTHQQIRREAMTSSHQCDGCIYDEANAKAWVKFCAALSVLQSAASCLAEAWQTRWRIALQSMDDARHRQVKRYKELRHVIDDGLSRLNGQSETILEEVAEQRMAHRAQFHAVNKETVEAPNADAQQQLQREHGVENPDSTALVVTQETMNDTTMPMDEDEQIATPIVHATEGEQQQQVGAVDACGDGAACGQHAAADGSVAINSEATPPLSINKRTREVAQPGSGDEEGDPSRPAKKMKSEHVAIELDSSNVPMHYQRVPSTAEDEAALTAPPDATAGVVQRLEPGEGEPPVEASVGVSTFCWFFGKASAAVKNWCWL